MLVMLGHGIIKEQGTRNKDTSTPVAILLVMQVQGESVKMHPYKQFQNILSATRSSILLSGTSNTIYPLPSLTAYREMRQEFWK